MSGNASRYSHQRARRFSQLILSQGAMVTDADQREGMAIGLRNTTTLGDTSIRTGVPQTGGLVSWTEALNPSSHKTMTGIRPGMVMADGHVGEVRLVEGAVLADGPGLDLHNLQQDLLGAPEIDNGAGPHVLFADLWHRHVGPAEDARMVDPAFLSAETSSRTELMAQLKLARLTDALTDAELVERIQDNGLPRFGDFRLTAVEFADEIVEPDDCDPCATTLEDPTQNAGNSHFRLEVHSSAYNTANLMAPTVPAAAPGETQIVVKWSHDNGSVEVPVTAAQSLLSDTTFDTAVFELTTLHAEQRMGLYTSGMSDRLATLHARADIDAAIAAAPEGAMLRVWDGAVRIELDDGDLAVAPIGTLSAQGSITVVDGAWTMQIELGGLDLTLVAAAIETVPYVLPGDAWCVQIREYAMEDGDKLIWQPEPVEIEHHYTFIGFTENGVFRNEDQPDMRARAFPALTELDALDIAYDNSRSEADAWTVQGALDLLFERPAGEGHDCLCTFCIDPDRDLTKQLLEIADLLNSNKVTQALICIPAGRFVLLEPVLFRAGEAVTLRGAGRDLTVIEMTKVAPETGAIQFFGLDAARVENMSFVGDMLVDEPEEGAWVIGVHEVGDFSAWRVSVRVARNDKGLAHGIAVKPMKKDDAATKVTVRESLFRVDANAQAIGIWRGGANLTIKDNEFRALNVETLGGAGKLSASTDFAARTRVNRRTPEREAQIADGFFAVYPGNSELLLNFTDLPPATRPVAGRYWQLALKMLADGGEIGNPKEFTRVQQNLTTINAASNRLIEAEIMALNTKGDAGASRFPVLEALTGKGTGLTFSGISRNTAGVVGNFTDFRPILVAGGSIEDDADTSGATTASDKAALDLVLKADALITDNIKVANFVEQLAPILDLIARSRENSLPTWGVFSFTGTAIPTSIIGNTFFELDVSIDLAALKTDPQIKDQSTPVMTTIRDNNVWRLVRLGRVFPPEWGDGGAGIFDGRQPITLTNCEDVTVENNTIVQIKPGDLSNEEFSKIYGLDFPEPMASFAAISLNQNMGPKLRSIGNSATNVRHCVHVNCFPHGLPPDPDGIPQNFWIFKENSSLPIPKIEPPVAVQFSNTGENALNFVKHCIRDNWFGNAKFEG